MKANELAQQISQKVTNDAISRGQGELLFKLAQESGQVEIAGQLSSFRYIEQWRDLEALILQRRSIL